MNNQSLTVDSRRYLVVGVCAAAHGVKGAVKFISYTEPKSSITSYEHFYICTTSRTSRKVMKKLAAHSFGQAGKFFTMQIEGFTNREQASDLRNLPLYVERSQLPELPEGEFYWFELIGLQVHNDRQQFLGEVTQMLPTGANDVLEVSLDVDDKVHRELIPYVPEVVVKVDAHDQTMLVKWDLPEDDAL